ncbi:Formyl transferase [groundwater metagenome]|uniref:phosphoribosylglycinamide formyltransferase 1 n=1 Tax=groundwater metagenome TaxID=717931 RepID=A0A098ED00_9ZZZZ
MGGGTSEKNKENKPKVVYAGDRDISVLVLKFIIDQGLKPICLMVSDKNKATHDKELISLCDNLDPCKILRGDQFRTEENINLLRNLNPDYIICVHFPYHIPKEVLDIPKEGVLNLHPAYLPHNRGWHTPTWAILEGTPYGATLHFMDERIDTGDIIHQKQIEIMLEDTADTLYHRVKKVEFEVFKEVWQDIASKNYTRKHQPTEGLSAHKKTDIEPIQFIDLKEKVIAGDLIKLIRALTTNNLKEAAYFKINNKKYRIQIHIIPEKEGN